jgi:hypothetical protein
LEQFWNSNGTGNSKMAIFPKISQKIESKLNKSRELQINLIKTINGYHHEQIPTLRTIQSETATAEPERIGIRAIGKKLC